MLLTSLDRLCTHKAPAKAEDIFHFIFSLQPNHKKVIDESSEDNRSVKKSIQIVKDSRN